MIPRQTKLIEKSIFDILDKTVSLHVHSQFEKAINFKNGEIFFSLLISEDAASKNSIVLKKTASSLKTFPDFQTDMKINLTTKGIFHHQNCLISFEEATTFDPLSLRIQSEQPRHLAFCTTFLETHGNFDALIEPPKKAFKDSLFSGKKKASLHSFEQLIGLGTGLSPSGDDFCSGFIGTLSLLRNHRTFTETTITAALAKIIQDHYDGTTFMGKVLLENALLGYLPKSMTVVINALFQQQTTVRSLSSLLKNVLAIGHSSGSELLDGLITGLIYLKEQSK
tara:strand:+ start:717 stop:1559 length:843 start_codon:yes stop_codon:yes gene_type:complete